MTEKPLLWKAITVFALLLATASLMIAIHSSTRNELIFETQNGKHKMRLNATDFVFEADGIPTLSASAIGPALRLQGLNPQLIVDDSNTSISVRPSALVIAGRPEGSPHGQITLSLDGPRINLNAAGPVPASAQLSAHPGHVKMELRDENVPAYKLLLPEPVPTPKPAVKPE